jgi:phospholipase C
MDGFARTTLASMLYWTDADLPFYYSLAKTFTVGNRWFGSAPCQTFPNRRFLLAGTAYGLISTDTASVLDPPPPNGTIVDRFNAHSIPWRNYFTDLPGTGVIGSIVQNNPANMSPISQFFSDCAAGSLPAVSFVDPEFGATTDIGSALSGIPGVSTAGNAGATQGGDEENPQNITLGEDFVARVVDAVLHSPAWPRTLLVWTYDEHGGYYDHVPPPAAIPPDNIKPKLGPNDAPGGYDIYGPRVPAVVVSPYAKPNAVTDVVHDHTSILATIEAKWNLEALTYRDANAATLMDFLDPRHAAFANPPTLAAPSDAAASESTCSNETPKFTVHPNPPPTGTPSSRPKRKRRHKHRKHRRHRHHRHRKH